MANLNGSTITGTAAGTIQKDQFVSFGYDFANASFSDNFFVGIVNAYHDEMIRVNKYLAIAVEKYDPDTSNDTNSNVSFGIATFVLSQDETTVTRASYGIATGYESNITIYGISLFNQSKGIVVYKTTSGTPYLIEYRIFTINSNNQITYSPQYDFYSSESAPSGGQSVCRNIVYAGKSYLKLNSDGSITNMGSVYDSYGYRFPKEPSLNSNEDSITIHSVTYSNTGSTDRYITRRPLNLASAQTRLLSVTKQNPTTFSYYRNKYLMGFKSYYTYIYSIDSGFTTATMTKSITNMDNASDIWRYGRTAIYGKFVSFGESYYNYYWLSSLTAYDFDGETVENKGEVNTPMSLQTNTLSGSAADIINIIPMGTGKFFLYITKIQSYGQVATSDHRPYNFGYLLTVPIKVYPTLIGEEFDGVALASASNGASVQVSAKF